MTKKAVKKGFAFPRRRVMGKGKFKRHTKSPTSEGIRFKKFFVRGGSHSIFDEDIDEKKPRIYFWANKLRTQLLSKVSYLEQSKRDIFSKFMQFIRKKLWLGPSAYQNKVMSNVIYNSPLDREGN